MSKSVVREKSTPENLSAGIYSDLRMKLIIGDLRPAETVSIRTLAEEYKVSAMPVREALRQLASEKALIGAAKKAYRVPDLTPEEAADLFYVRAVLEGAAAEVAAEYVSEADLKELEHLTRESEKIWKERDVRKLLLVNFQFHSKIYGLTGNSALHSMIDGLYVLTGPWLAHGIADFGNPSTWLDEHADIILALRKRDGARARRLMEADAQWAVHLYRDLG